MGSYASAGRWPAVVATLLVVGLAPPVGSSAVAAAAQDPKPASKSAPHAKELAALLVSKNLETYAAADPAEPGRFVAVLHIPGVQLLAVSAVYDRPSDIEYRIYRKDFMGAYVDLNNSVLSKSRFRVEDTMANGLVAMPAKGEGADTVLNGVESRTFDGDFADPRKGKNGKKISQEDYLKAFAEADEKYDHVLVTLLDELKKAAH
jgi:hypothetical protein